MPAESKLGKSRDSERSFKRCLIRSWKLRAIEGSAVSEGNRRCVAAGSQETLSLVGKSSMRNSSVVDLFLTSFGGGRRETIPGKNSFPELAGVMKDCCGNAVKEAPAEVNPSKEDADMMISL